MLTNRFALLSIEGFFKPGFSSLMQKRLLICRKRMQLKMSYHLTSSLNRHFAELFQQHYHKIFTKLRFRKTFITRTNSATTTTMQRHKNQSYNLKTFSLYRHKSLKTSLNPFLLISIKSFRRLKLCKVVLQHSRRRRRRRLTVSSYAK